MRFVNNLRRDAWDRTKIYYAHAPKAVSLKTTTRRDERHRASTKRSYPSLSSSAMTRAFESFTERFFFFFSFMFWPDDSIKCTHYDDKRLLCCEIKSGNVPNVQLGNFNLNEFVFHRMKKKKKSSSFEYR